MFRRLHFGEGEVPLKFVLHAGTHKTGTTSIQKALSDNRAWLRERGLIYPGGVGVYSPEAPLKRHHVFARSFTGIYPRELAQAGQFLDDVRAQLESPRDVILLSTEEVYRHIEGYGDWQHFAEPDYWARREGYLRLLAKALENFDVKVLLFFRERLSFARSLYAELVYRNKGTRWQGSPAEFVKQFYHWFEYEQQIAMFKAVFSNVCVSSYERATERGLVRTFFQIIEFPMPPNADQIWRRSTPQDIDVSNVELPASVIAAPAFLPPCSRPAATHSKLASRESTGRISTISSLARRAQRGMSHQERLKQVHWIARTMDEKFQVPGTRLRFGWDAIMGLIPGIGDALASVASLVIVHHAWRLGMPCFLLLRMLGNIGIDLILGIVPVAGDALDLAWKANRKNVRLLELSARQRKRCVSEFPPH